MNEKIEVFLCYDKADIKEVEKYYEKLEKVGFKPWLDKKELLAGEVWEEAIKKAIKNCDFFIAFLSKNSVTTRGFRHREILIALKVWEEQPEGKIYLIPARLEKVDVPTNLTPFHWVDIYEEEGFEKLLNSLRKEKGGCPIIGIKCEACPQTACLTCPYYKKMVELLKQDGTKE